MIALNLGMIDLMIDLMLFQAFDGIKVLYSCLSVTLANVSKYLSSRD